MQIEIIGLKFRNIIKFLCFVNDKMLELELELNNGPQPSITVYDVIEEFCEKVFILKESLPLSIFRLKVTHPSGFINWEWVSYIKLFYLCNLYAQVIYYVET